MNELWHQVCEVIGTVIAKAGPGYDVVGVGVCGHNDGLYAVDEHLRPVRPAILAMDSRAHRESTRLTHGAALFCKDWIWLGLTGEVATDVIEAGVACKMPRGIRRSSSTAITSPAGSPPRQPGSPASPQARP